MSLSTENLWAIYANQIAKAAGLPGSPSDFILTGTGLNANLATKSVGLPAKPSAQEALFEIYKLGNTLIDPSGIYSPTANGFFNDYATYIDNLLPAGANPATPGQTAQLKMLQAQLNTAVKQRNTDLDRAFTNWGKQGIMFPHKYKTFTDFLNLTPAGGIIAGDDATIAGIESSLSTLKTKIYGTGYIAIGNAKTVVDNVRKDLLATVASSPAEMAVAATSGTMIVPTYNPGDLSVFSAWVDGIITSGAENQPISTTFSTSSSKYDFSRSHYFSHTSWSTDYFFFSAGGSSTVEKTSVDIDTSHSDFNLTISFAGVTEVPVSRGPWFDSSLMYDFKKANKDNLLSPTILYVAMFPTIKLTMDQGSYNSAYSAYNSSSGFGVGCWFVSSGGDSTSSSNTQMSAQWDSNGNSVTISPSSVQPVVVAMKVTDQ